MTTIMTNQPSDNLNKALPDWVCFPDDEPSHLTNRVQYEYGTGCPEHEIAGGSSLPTAQLQALINNEKIEARIDELERLTFDSFPARTVQERIATLKKGDE